MQIGPTYPAKDWLRLKPLQHALKRQRNRMVSDWFAGRPARNQAALDRVIPDLAGRRVIFTVAFNKPWLIELMILSTARHMPDWSLVVLDNSSKPDLRSEIAALCAAGGVVYADLPRNPEWNPNRSHGISLNWAVRRVVREAAPARFGFLDHDCFPFRRTTALDMLDEQPLYGWWRASPYLKGAWSIWPGYCFYDWATLRDHAFDFSHDQSIPMDTGGMNWRRVYSRLDITGYRFATSEFRPQFLGPDDEMPAQVFDDQFVHLGAVGHRPEAPRKNYLRNAVAFVKAAAAE